MPRHQTSKTLDHPSKVKISAKGSYPVKIPDFSACKVLDYDPFFSPGPGKRSSKAVYVSKLARVPVKPVVGLRASDPVHISVVMSEVMTFILTCDNLNLHLTGEVD